METSSVTRGDGNCWYRAIIEQMRRPEIIAVLDSSKVFEDHRLLRLAVVNFVRVQEPISPFIQNYHVIYEQTIAAEHNNMSWEEFLNDQEIDGKYFVRNCLHMLPPFFFLSISWYPRKPRLMHIHTHVLPDHGMIIRLCHCVQCL